MNARGSIEVRQTEAVTHLKNLNEKCIQELNAPLDAILTSEMLVPDLDLEAAKTPC